jgi:site-specific DNA-methyltransferase (adenine-specific)
MRKFIIASSNEGQCVLDPFMGSGTTAIACIKEKRHFIGFELNEEYYNKACKRIKDEQLQLKLF